MTENKIERKSQIRKRQLNDIALFVVAMVMHVVGCSMQQWRAATSESGHAICMPKSGHENEYVMGKLMSETCNILLAEKNFCVRL